LKVVFAAKGHLIFENKQNHGYLVPYMEKFDFSKMAPILQTIENFFAIWQLRRSFLMFQLLMLTHWTLPATHLSVQHN
jgi:hypothetical protein